jgi:hypothetical protein
MAFSSSNSDGSLNIVTSPKQKGLNSAKKNKKNSENFLNWIETEPGYIIPNSSTPMKKRGRKSSKSIEYDDIQANAEALLEIGSTASTSSEASVTSERTTPKKLTKKQLASQQNFAPLNITPDDSDDMAERAEILLQMKSSPHNSILYA